MKNSVLYLILAAVGGFLLWQYFKRGGVNNQGYTLSTPFGGGSIQEDPLAGTVNVSATIAKKKGKKKGLFKGKLKGFLKKGGGQILAGAASFIPGIGPAMSTALMKASTIKTGNFV